MKAAEILILIRCSRLYPDADHQLLLLWSSLRSVTKRGGTWSLLRSSELATLAKAIYDAP